MNLIREENGVRRVEKQVFGPKKEKGIRDRIGKPTEAISGRQVGRCQEKAVGRGEISRGAKRDGGAGRTRREPSCRTTKERSRRQAGAAGRVSEGESGGRGG